MGLDGYRNAEDTQSGPTIIRPRKLLDPLSRIGNSYETEGLYRLFKTGKGVSSLTVAELTAHACFVDESYNIALDVEILGCLYLYAPAKRQLMEHRMLEYIGSTIIAQIESPETTTSLPRYQIQMTSIDINLHTITWLKLTQQYRPTCDIHHRPWLAEGQLPRH